MDALEGIRVIDLTTGIAGPNCSKLLADFGAEVIKVEPPGGDPTRDVPPFAGNERHPERSLLFLHLNTNKRSVVLDLESPAGRDAARALVREAQVVIEDFPPGRADELGLGPADLRSERPQLIYCSITPWGQDGPFVEQGLRGSELLYQGMGGPANATGHAEKGPLKLGGNVAQMQAGVVAAFGIVGAVYRVEGGGEGDRLDISIYETQAGTRDRRTTSLTAFAYTGYPSKRTSTGIALASGVKPTQDGYINLMATGRQRMDNFVRLIGREDLVGDERLVQQPTSLDPAFVEELQAAYLAWLMSLGKREAVAIAQSNELLAGVISTPEDLVTDPHYRDRGVWETIEHPVAGTAEYPGRPFIMSDTPRAPARRAPLLGEHTVEVLTTLAGLSEDEARRLASAPAG